MLIRVFPVYRLEDHKTITYCFYLRCFLLRCLIHVVDLCLILVVKAAKSEN